jgi:hypothetical protein
MANQEQSQQSNSNIIVYPTITAPINSPSKTPEEAAKGHSTTTMIFDNDVHLTVGTNNTIFYPKGVHEVPDHLAGHWYLAAHNVRTYAKRVNIVAAVPASAGKGARKK